MTRPDFYWLNTDSRKFLSRDYLKPGESAENRITEIAEAGQRILSASGKYLDFAEKFCRYMARGFYSLSTPIWTNFGRGRAAGISCYGSTTSDTTDSILYKNAEVGMMTKLGGGTSGYFGHLRGRGAAISGGGASTGVCHFLEMFNHTMGIVSQGSVRRGAFAAYLPIDHPDIEEFLQIRGEGNPIQDLSFGVCVSDEWMRDMINKKPRNLKIWSQVLRKRSETGYPYIFFTDNANRGRPQVYKDLGMEITHSNLCVTGGQRAVSNFGLLTAKELFEIGEPMTLFDNEKAVNATPMRLIEKDAEVYRVTLENGMSHEVTSYHKVSVSRGLGADTLVECKDLKIGDFVAVQTQKGIFGPGPTEGISFAAGAVPSPVWAACEALQKKYLLDLFGAGSCLQGDDKFLRDVQLLLLNLGQHSTIFEEDGIKFLSIVPEVLQESHYAITSVDYIGKEDVYCCTVDSPEHLWVCNGFVTSNCSEIMLPDTDTESFVCDLSSMNAHTFDEWRDTDAVEVLVQLLDAVMTEFIEKISGERLMQDARRFAIRHRALGVGMLGWHSYLQSKMIAFESMEAYQENVRIWKFMRQRAEKGSRELAEVFGEPEVMEGYGMRNATLLACAPTTSSSFILGQISPSIEPLNGNYFVKDLAKGTYSWRNPELKELLEIKGKDTEEVWMSILKKGGSVQHLEFLDEHEKKVFKTFGEISQKEIVIQAAQRQKEIDQGQSLNTMIGPHISPKEINQLIIFAWEQGIKSLYYQRSTNPSQELARKIMTCSTCEA